MTWESHSTLVRRDAMTWNAALKISYARPMAGREAKAIEVFADALTIYG